METGKDPMEGRTPMELMSDGNWMGGMVLFSLTERKEATG